jgi:hypothetical protein
VGAHRGGGAIVGWWRDFGTTAVGSGVSTDGGWRCPEARLQLCESEGGVRAEPNCRSGEEGAWWRLSPRRGDDVSGMAKFPVRGGALTVGAVGKAMGGCSWGPLKGGRRKEKELRRCGIGRRPFQAALQEAEGGGKWGSGRCVEAGEAREGGRPSPTR